MSSAPSDPCLASPRCASATPPHTHRLQKDWPFCNPCKDDQSCYEFKPGVSKCITKTESGEAFLKEGELCMDFSGKKRKWAGSNPKLFGMSCQWPQFSCNYDAEADNGTYRWAGCWGVWVRDRASCLWGVGAQLP